MKRFARLYAELDASTATGAKVDALRRYFAAAAPADAAWAVYFLAGGRPRQVVPTTTWTSPPGRTVHVSTAVPFRTATRCTSAQGIRPAA